MKRMIKNIGIGTLAAALLLVATACAGLARDLDVIGKGSVTSFEALLQYAPTNEDASAFALSAPDGAARFLWGRAGSGEARYDAALAVDAAPFLAAGLDASKLPEDYTLEGESLIVGVKLDAKEAPQENPLTPLSAYARIVELAPGSIGYHGSMDHYGVSLGGGNMFEWARDMAKNDKDIVFVLAPEPLIAAGVDPDGVEGWVHGKVPVHEGGKTIEVDKLLKPFNLD